MRNIALSFLIMQEIYHYYLWQLFPYSNKNTIIMYKKKKILLNYFFIILLVNTFAFYIINRSTCSLVLALAQI